MEEQELTGVEPAEVEEQEEATTSEEPEVEPEETEEEGEEEEQEEEPPKKSKGVQKRIDQLVKEREEEKRRAERLEQMLHEMYSKTQQKPEEQPQQVSYPEKPPTPPDRYEFDDDEQYRTALNKYQDDLGLYVQGQNKRARDELIQYAQQNKQRQTVQQFLGDTVAKGREKYEDFEAVGFIPVGTEDIFQDAENSVDIAYYLGKNQAEAQRIASMPKHKAAFEIAKLDARFAAKPEKTVTKAPAPVKPVGGREPATNNILDLPVDEYIREMNKKQFG